VVAAGSRGGGIIEGVTVLGGYARATIYAGFFGSGDTCFVVEGPLSMGAGVTALSGQLILQKCIITRCIARGGVAISAVEIAELTIEDCSVSEGHGLLPNCPLLESVSALALSGIDSILIRPGQVHLKNMHLARTNTTTPFDGVLVGNLNLGIVLSDINLTGRFGNQGFIRLQSLCTDSSVIRSMKGTSAAAGFDTHRFRSNNSGTDAIAAAGHRRIRG